MPLLHLPQRLRLLRTDTTERKKALLSQRIQGMTEEAEQMRIQADRALGTPSDAQRIYSRSCSSAETLAKELEIARKGYERLSRAQGTKVRKGNVEERLGLPRARRVYEEFLAGEGQGGVRRREEEVVARPSWEMMVALETIQELLEDEGVPRVGALQASMGVEGVPQIEPGLVLRRSLSSGDLRREYLESDSGRPASFGVEPTANLYPGPGGRAQVLQAPVIASLYANEADDEEDEAMRKDSGLELFELYWADEARMPRPTSGEWFVSVLDGALMEVQRNESEESAELGEKAELSQEYVDAAVEAGMEAYHASGDVGREFRPERYQSRFVEHF